MFLHRRVHDPNLRLEGAFGNGFKLHQVHVLDVHEPLADLPFFAGRRVHGVRALRFSIRRCRGTVAHNNSRSSSPGSS